MNLCRCHRAQCALAMLLTVSCFTTSVFAAARRNFIPASSFRDEFVVTWAPNNVRFPEVNSDALQLVLDQNTGSGFASKDSFLFGNIDMEMKLIPGDSAGTVTTFYLSSEGSNHDELDFEFLGNTSGQPYALQTNVFSSGIGGREQRIFLWFDPTKDFHTYSVRWSPYRVVFLVDGTPIRVFSNNEAVGVPYMRNQPMRVFSSIFNGDSWATQGGAVKIEWSHGPFAASYRGFSASNACRASSSAGAVACVRAASNHISATGGMPKQKGFNRRRLNWVKRNFMIYDYCKDVARYSPAPPECTREF
ncbi:hypothetical protein KP509_19G020900 [Ceratopteris richardii]|uniref:Xyloglucan endotransglucosylase/hydrolase n=1 Tax=Ceratopteris richardii TaxID=49495 RepID=A0A8T2SIM9_CERRI|nr:hypothetical protein KP509_19G020900 [Ceratopteris richardii]